MGEKVSPLRVPLVQLSDPRVTLDFTLIAAQQIADRLRTLSATVGPMAQASQFYTRVRVKTKDSLEAKVQKKSQERKLQNKSYTFRNLTDIVGFRVVSLFDDQLQAAMGYIIDLIRSGQQLPDPLFNPIEDAFSLIREALFIRRSEDEFDPYNICADALIKSAEIGKIQISHVIKRSVRMGERYSSAHIIADGLGYVAGFALRVPIEFQLRTAAEDIWSEINHKFVYKSKPDGIWSRTYSKEYERSRQVSNRLKGEIDRLSQTIAEFQEASKNAEQEIKKFWSVRRKLQFSYCISLFNSACGGSLPDALYQHVTDYERALSASVREQRNLETGPSKLVGALTSLQSLRAAIDGDPELSSSGGIKFRNELAAICVLEELRLRTWSLLVYRYPLEQFAAAGSRAGRPWLGEMAEMEGKGEGVRRSILSEHSMQLYVDFCGYLERAVEIKPVSVILYFKHLLARGFLQDGLSGRQLAERAIRSSFEQLDFDETIPTWSIYRVLIPRMYAAHLLGEVRYMLGQVLGEEGMAELSSSTKDKLMETSALRNNIEVMLMDALKLSIRALKEYVDVEENLEARNSRGDAFFRFDERVEPAIDSPLADTQDARLVVDIWGIYRDKYDNVPTRLLPTERDDCYRCLGKTRFLFGSNPEYSEQIDQILSELARALPNE